jgi:FHA domain
LSATGPGRPATAPQRGAELQREIAVKRAGLPYVRWRDAAGELHFRSLSADDGRLTIGRDPDADIAFTGDPEVSRTHAVLDRVGGAWTLLDDGLSRNGSHVNARAVAGRQRLADGDRILVGGSEVTYHAAATRLAGEETVTAGAGLQRKPLSETQRKVLIALSRPKHDSESATPATNAEIGDEVGLSVDAVKSHLRGLFEIYGVADLPQNRKRAELVNAVLLSKQFAPHEFARPEH